MNEVPRLWLMQNQTISNNRFYFPSTFPRSRRYYGCNCILCTSNEFEKTLKKSLYSYHIKINLKGQRLPKHLTWSVKKERHFQKAGELLKT